MTYINLQELLSYKEMATEQLLEEPGSKMRSLFRLHRYEANVWSATESKIVHEIVSLEPNFKISACLHIYLIEALSPQFSKIRVLVDNV